MSLKNYYNKSSLRAALVWIYLIAGVACLIIPLIAVPDNNTAFIKAITKLGEILLISTLFTFLTSSTQFLDLFLKTVEDIILGDKFLRKRNDIEDLWGKVSKVMFKQKFPAINDKLISTIKSSYLSNEDVNYYSNRRNFIEIDWDDHEHKYMVIKEKVLLRYHTDLTSFTEFPSEFWLPYKEGDDFGIDDFKKKSYYSIKYKVSGKDVDHRLVENKITECGEQRYVKTVINLSGSNEYDIEYNVTRRYSIEDDDFIGFKSRCILNNLYLTITYPKDMIINVLSRGTLKDFQCKFKSKTKNILEYQYEDLILRRQGYLITLKKEATHEN